MRRGRRNSRWQGALALPLALWSAVPGVQWCPLGWAEVSAECFAECRSPAAILNVGSQGCCERSCAVAGSETSSAADAEASCLAEGSPSTCGSDVTLDSDAASDDRYPGGRAYCLAGPSGGDGLLPATPAAPDASGPTATIPADTEIAAVASHARSPVTAAPTHPPPSPIGAVPRGRAPPRIGRTTC